MALQSDLINLHSHQLHMEVHISLYFHHYILLSDISVCVSLIRVEWSVSGQEHSRSFDKGKLIQGIDS